MGKSILSRFVFPPLLTASSYMIMPWPFRKRYPSFGWLHAEHLIYYFSFWDTCPLSRWVFFYIVGYSFIAITCCAHCDICADDFGPGVNLEGCLLAYRLLSCAGRSGVILLISLMTSLPGLFIVYICLSECMSATFVWIDFTSMNQCSGPHSQNMGRLGEKSQTRSITHSFLCDHFCPDIFPRTARHSQEWVTSSPLT